MSNDSHRWLSGLVPSGHRKLVAVGAALALIAGFAALPALAIHNTGDTSLELDGNVADNPAGVPDDWNSLFTINPPNTSTFDWTGVITDPDNATIFTGAQAGGSSKDGQDVTGWRWKCGSVPAKDEIQHAASAKYTTATGEKRLYFMGDREAVNGDSHIGVWFFRNSVSTVEPDCPGAGTFSAAHTAGSVPHDPTNSGDILVLADFANGGTSVDIKVFEWVGSGGNDAKSKGALNKIGEGGRCDLISHTAGSPEVCAIPNPMVLGPGNGADNTAGTDDDGPAWTFAAKSGPAGAYPINSFFEGGLDLNSFGLQGECFGSVLTETRSSDETDAILKDFVVSPFEPCHPTLTTSVNKTDPVRPGDTVTDSATLTGLSGGGLGPAPKGSISFFVCGPFTTPTACTPTDTTKTAAGTSDLSSNTLNPVTVTSSNVNKTATGYYCFLARYSGDSNYAAVDENSTSTECYQVVTVPTTTTTRQFVYPQDKAKVTATAGGDLAGSVRFRLYDTLANCTADGGTAATGMLYQELGTSHLISGAAPQYATTGNTTVAITSDTTVYWRVFYHSTNTAQDDSSSVCEESTQVAYVGNDGTITVP